MGLGSRRDSRRVKQQKSTAKRDNADGQTGVTAEGATGNAARGRPPTMVVPVAFREHHSAEIGSTPGFLFCPQHFGVDGTTDKGVVIEAIIELRWPSAEPKDADLSESSPEESRRGETAKERRGAEPDGTATPDRVLASDCVFHPSGGWICRAFPYGDQEGGSGASSRFSKFISVHHTLTACPILNDLTNSSGMTGQVLQELSDVRRRYGLTHVELAVAGQNLGRADMHLISTALRDEILYQGMEIKLYDYRLRVTELFFSGKRLKKYVPEVAPSTLGDHSRKDVAGLVPVGYGVVTSWTLVNFRSLSPIHYVVLELSQEMWNTTVDGRVALTWALKKFLREFFSEQLPTIRASPLLRLVYTGRLRAFEPEGDWDRDATDEAHDMPDTEPEPYFRRHHVTGRGEVLDVFHVEEISLKKEQEFLDAADQAALNCDAFLQQLRQGLDREKAKVRDWHRRRRREGAGTPAADPAERDSNPTQATDDCDTCAEADIGGEEGAGRFADGTAFTCSQESNLVEALAMILEWCRQQQRADTPLHTSGLAITVVSAGKGVYDVTNAVVQIVCTHLHDLGVERVNFVSLGRPPLHVTPLLVYSTRDLTLLTQSHLNTDPPSSRGNRSGSGDKRDRYPDGETAETLYFESPEWMRVLFYYPRSVTNAGDWSFELLSKEEWTQRHHRRAETGSHDTDVTAVQQHPTPGAPRQLQPSTEGKVLLPGLGIPMFPVQSVVLPRHHLHPHGDDDGRRMDWRPHSRGKWGQGSALVPYLTFHLHDSQYGAAEPAHGDDEAWRAIKAHNVFHRLHCPSTTFPPHAEEVENGSESLAVGLRAEWFGIRPTTAEDTVMCPAMTDDEGLPGFVSYGHHVLDSDLGSGQVVLQLTLVRRHGCKALRWDPRLLEDDAMWNDFVRSFSGRDGQLAVLYLRHQHHRTASHRKPPYHPSFSPKEVFSREGSRMTACGKALTLATRAKECNFHSREEIVMNFRPEAYTVLDEGNDECDAGPLGQQLVSVGNVLLGNRVLFGISLIDPFTGAEDTRGYRLSVLSHSVDVVSTATVFRRRWHHGHPTVPVEAAVAAGGPRCLELRRRRAYYPHEPESAAWKCLCSTRLLPIFGLKATFTRACFIDISPRQHTIGTTEEECQGRLMEFILQRLDHQFQIVWDGATSESSAAAGPVSSGAVSGAAGAATRPPVDGTGAEAPGRVGPPRMIFEPAPNASMELTMCHQNHIIKVREGGQSISVTGDLHLGRYTECVEEPPILTYHYALWNFLSERHPFSPRRLEMKPLLEKSRTTYWDVLDMWLAQRSSEHLQSIPDRVLPGVHQTGVVLLPRLEPLLQRTATGPDDGGATSLSPSQLMASYIERVLRSFQRHESETEASTEDFASSLKRSATGFPSVFVLRCRPPEGDTSASRATPPRFTVQRNPTVDVSVLCASDDPVPTFGALSLRWTCCSCQQAATLQRLLTTGSSTLHVAPFPSLYHKNGSSGGHELGDGEPFVISDRHKEELSHYVTCYYDISLPSCTVEAAQDFQWLIVNAITTLPGTPAARADAQPLLYYRDADRANRDTGAGGCFVHCTGLGYVLLYSTDRLKELVATQERLTAVRTAAERGRWDRVEEAYIPALPPLAVGEWRQNVPHAHGTEAQLKLLCAIRDLVRKTREEWGQAQGITQPLDHVDTLRAGLPPTPLSTWSPEPLPTFLEPL